MDNELNTKKNVLESTCMNYVIAKRHLFMKDGLEKNKASIKTILHYKKEFFIIFELIRKENIKLGKNDKEFLEHEKKVSHEFISDSKKTFNKLIKIYQFNDEVEIKEIENKYYDMNTYKRFYIENNTL